MCVTFVVLPSSVRNLSKESSHMIHFDKKKTYFSFTIL